MTRRVPILGVGVAIGVGLLWWLSLLRDPEQGQPTIKLAVEGRASHGVSLGSDGELVATAWGATQPSGATDVFTAVSVDGGRSFGPPVRVNDVEGTARVNGEMAPRVAIRAREGAPPLVHVLWTAKGDGMTIRLARSDDGGRGFAPSRELQESGAAGDRGWAALALGPDGEPRVVWLDHREMAGGDSAGSGGARHRGHDSTSAGGAPADGVALAARSAIYFSDGTGERALASGVCYCCKTAIGVSRDGHVLAAWRHVYPGNVRDIAFTASDDGREFIPPVRVSQDEWQIDGCPDDGPALAVARDGTVHLAWPTVVSQPAPHKAVFYAASRDGRSFAPRIAVTSAGRNASHPQIAVGDDGRVVVTWDEIVDGARRVFMSRLSGGRFTEPEPLSRAESATYPAVAFSGGALVAAWTEGPPESSRIEVRRLPLDEEPAG